MNLGLGPQFGVFTTQTAGFKRALNSQKQLVGFKGLFDKIVGALADSGDGGLDIEIRFE